MPGKAKRKYEGELMRFNKQLKRPIKLIAEILPKDYTDEDILIYFKKFYPFEWKTICQRYETYQQKDEFLVSKGKKRRYKHLPPKKYFYSLNIVKNLMNEKYRKKYSESYNNGIREEKLLKLEHKRNNKINKREDKIAKFKENIQNVEPYFLDVYIAAYHRKGNTIENKIEIFKEIQKYDCLKSNIFFLKLNDSEKNLQIKQMAFEHLSKSGYYVKLRQNPKGKRKAYMLEKSQFYMTPEDLYYRLNNDSIQNKKEYDVFISHSSKDSDLVRKIIKALNKEKLNCYCDWTSDNDFLRRELVSDFTKEALKVRMKQCKKFLLIETKNALESEWVNFELEYYSNINKSNMFYISIEGDDINGLKKLSYDNKNNKVILEDLHE
ncbi:toll/interleukin-1 receptor domain-containing protein [Intestinibacter sp.]